MAEEDQFFCFQLPDGKAEELSRVDGCDLIIQNIIADSSSFDKITVEAIFRVIRLDKTDDENDTAVSDFYAVTLATIFPSNRNLSVEIPFTSLNSISLRATGGNVKIVGRYFPSNPLLSD